MNELSPGDRIGPYEIIRELGRGGMGVVYKANEPSLGRSVALKVLTDSLATNEEFLDRFEREARAAARLSHPAIVTVYQIGADGPRRYIALEFIRGRDLSHIIEEEGALDLRRALDVVAQVADALAAAHEVGIVHRDIKPQNVMVQPDGRVKVMDFGIAKVDEGGAGKLTRTGTILGTPAYMSPEQCRGEAVDGRADVFSLGAVLYEALTGRMAFGAESVVAVIQRILFQPPPPLKEVAPHIPKEVVRIVDKATAKEPEKRYADARAMLEDLREVVARMDVAKTLAGAPPLPFRIPTDGLAKWPEALRSRAGMAAAGGIGLALVAAIAVFAFSGGREADAPPAAEEAGGPGISAPAASGDAHPIAPVATASVVDPDLVTTATLTLAMVLAGDAIPVRVVAGRASGGAARAEGRVGSGAWQTLAPGEDFLAWPDDLTTETREVPVAFRALDETTGAESLPALLTARAVSPAEALDAAAAAFTGSSGLVDEPGAKNLFLRMAHSGDPVARLWVAWLTALGRCGFGDDVVAPLATVGATPSPEAIEAARKAAAAEIATQFFHAAADRADRGDPHANFLVGAVLDRGIGVAEDPVAAYRRVARAAETGFSPALNYLGFMTARGRGVEPDSGRALELFRAAARQGDTIAQHNLGMLLASPKDASEEAKGEALALFRDGAARGSAVVMNDLGWAFETGVGTESDADEARRWYGEAARLGNSSAADNLERLDKSLD